LQLQERLAVWAARADEFLECRERVNMKE
jgi:hypothetical protein